MNERLSAHWWCHCRDDQIRNKTIIATDKQRYNKILKIIIKISKRYQDVIHTSWVAEVINNMQNHKWKNKYRYVAGRWGLGGVLMLDWYVYTCINDLFLDVIVKMLAQTATRKLSKISQRRYPHPHIFLSAPRHLRSLVKITYIFSLCDRYNVPIKTSSIEERKKWTYWEEAWLKINVGPGNSFSWFMTPLQAPSPPPLSLCPR